MKKLLILLLAFMLSACTMPQKTDSTLEVHFLDVGQADSTLVLCGGEALLIDGGNSADSSFIYSYLQRNGIKFIDYIIATHPHEDHIGGIMGALSLADAGVCYSSVSDSEEPLFARLKDKLGTVGAELIVPSVGDSFSLGDASVTFLGPAEENDDENESSLVCRLDYGDTSFLFMGDAGEKSEKAMLGKDLLEKCTVLKVGHHGSSGSSCYEFLRTVSPDYAVISTENNSRYGHPHESTLSRLLDCGARVFRTDKNGSVIFRSDGVVMTVSPEKDRALSDETEAQTSLPEDAAYIGNLRSKKYHLSSCRSLPNENNRVYFYSLEEAINAEFSPCGSCIKQ